MVQHRTDIRFKKIILHLFIGHPIGKKDVALIYPQFLTQLNGSNKLLAVQDNGIGVMNAQENYESAIASARWSRRRADAGRIPEIEVELKQLDRDYQVIAQQHNAQARPNSRYAEIAPNTESMVTVLTKRQGADSFIALPIG